MLRKYDFGDKLLENFLKIVQLYLSYATCICFLGEGENTIYEHREFYEMTEIAGRYNLKTCLYCGRDTDIEEWMNIFDFVKLGSYREDLGGLDSPSTNQRFLEKTKGKYTDITYKFQR